jgi:hypothetical protein
MRQQVRRARRGGMSFADAEDRAQDAALLLLKEKPRAGAPPFAIRAARAFKTAEIDDHRRNTRKKRVPAEKLEWLDSEDFAEQAVEVDLDARLRMAELAAEVSEEIGKDGIKYLLEQQAGYTDADCEQRLQPGEATPRTIRRRLNRAAPTIAAKINRTLQGDE